MMKIYTLLRKQIEDNFWVYVIFGALGKVHWKEMFMFHIWGLGHRQLLPQWLSLKFQSFWTCSREGKVETISANKMRSCISATP